MGAYGHYNITYWLDGHEHQARTRIEMHERDDGTHYQAVLDDSPLRGTYGGTAKTVEGALDFLNLAMQAEGADEIHVGPLHAEGAADEERAA